MLDVVGSLILGVILLILGYFVMKGFYLCYRGNQNIKKNFPKVNVEIVSLDKYFRDGLMVSPTVRYYYNKKEYVQRLSRGYGGANASKLMKAQQIQNLKGFVDPKNPKVIFLDIGTLSFFSIILLFLSVGIFAGAIQIFITTFTKFTSFL